MTTGLLLLLGTGIGWAGLAAVVAAGTSREAPIAKVQPYSALLVLVFAGWSAFVFGGELHWTRAILFQFICLAAAGACNYFMLNLVQKGMRSGKSGVVWAFTQSSMICPFLLGMLGFGEALTLFRISGIVLILAGLIGFACERKSSTGTGERWLLPTFGAFLLSGLAQSCASLPSYFQFEGMTALRRMMLTQCGILLAFLIDSLLKRKLEPAGKTVWLFAGIFGLLNLGALLMFYNGLNILADAKCASAGYPAAQGCSIALFFLANCRKTHPGMISWIAFVLILGGISALALGA